MTTFSYSSGDPTNLVGGNTADMSDISGPFADVVTFLNGNIDTANLATSAKPVTLLGEWRTIDTQGAGLFGGETTGTYIVSDTSSFLQADGANLVNGHARFLMLDPADFAVTGLTAKLRVRFGIATNNTATDASLTAGLYPVSFAGANGTLTTTLGTVVSGSTVTVDPAANAEVIEESSDFNVPAAGIYMFGVAIDGTVLTACDGVMRFALQVHHV